MKKIKTPISDEEISELQIGDKISLSGVMYTGRDAALPQLVELIKKGKTPIDTNGIAIMHTAVSDAGIAPTTSNKEEIESTIPFLSKNGVKVICYNFMPIFDWTRTEMFHPLPDGSTALFFDKEKITSINPQELVEMVEKESRGLTLPGWEPERLSEVRGLFEAYKNVDEHKLRENFAYFLKAIIPTCEEVGIKMGFCTRRKGVL